MNFNRLALEDKVELGVDEVGHGHPLTLIAKHCQSRILTGSNTALISTSHDSQATITTELISHDIGAHNISAVFQNGTGSSAQRLYDPGFMARRPGMYDVL